MCTYQYTFGPAHFFFLFIYRLEGAGGDCAGAPLRHVPHIHFACLVHGPRPVALAQVAAPKVSGSQLYLCDLDTVEFRVNPREREREGERARERERETDRERERERMRKRHAHTYIYSHPVWSTGQDQSRSLKSLLQK